MSEPFDRGLGHATCLRLLDEFAKDPSKSSKRLTLIFTTRRPPNQIQTLKAGFENHVRRLGGTAAERVTIVAETVDLLRLDSVRALSHRLNHNFPKLDSIVLNAGIGGWYAMDWVRVNWKILTDFVYGTTWPDYKLGYVGMLVPKQTRLQAGTEAEAESDAQSSSSSSLLNDLKEPPLGAVFCANVFGHYMLAHNVMPLLKRSGQAIGPGRIIWVSSIESADEHFKLDDIQGLKSSQSYESSKTLTDILALTSDLPSTAPWVRRFMSIDDDAEENDEQKLKTSTTKMTTPPVIYVAHPGICSTTIFPLIFPLYWCMIAAFYLGRFLGSPWHGTFPYVGANSLVWLALSPKPTLDAAERPYRERGGGHVKWGSSVDCWSRECVASTETDGWGHGGVVDGEYVVEADRLRRRKRGMKLATREDRLRFEDLGRKCWQQMEDLRLKWDKLLDASEQMASRFEV